MEIDRRLRIKHLVSLQPGLHLRELQRLLGLSFSSTRYHVERMAKQGEIHRVEDGGFSRLFPPRTDTEDAILFSSLRRPTNLRILSSLVQHPGLTQKNLSDTTGLGKSTVSEAVHRLLAQCVIRVEHSANAEARYQVVDPAKLSMLINSNIGLLEKAAARFMELWDF